VVLTQIVAGNAPAAAVVDAFNLPFGPVIARSGALID
jgi:hypothetical protein